MKVEMYSFIANETGFTSGDDALGESSSKHVYSEHQIEVPTEVDFIKTGRNTLNMAAESIN